MSIFINSISAKEKDEKEDKDDKKDKKEKNDKEDKEEKKDKDEKDDKKEKNDKEDKEEKKDKDEKDDKDVNRKTNKNGNGKTKNGGENEDLEDDSIFIVSEDGIASKSGFYSIEDIGASWIMIGILLISALLVLIIVFIKGRFIYQSQENYKKNLEKIKY